MFASMTKLLGDTKWQSHPPESYFKKAHVMLSVDEKIHTLDNKIPSRSWGSIFCRLEIGNNVSS